MGGNAQSCENQAQGCKHNTGGLRNKRQSAEEKGEGITEDYVEEIQLMTENDEGEIESEDVAEIEKD